MSWAAGHLPTIFLPGEVRLVDGLELSGQLADAERHGLLPALPAPPGPAARGQLAIVIEAAIEGALERRGACPPGIRAASSLDAAFTDQLYRARLLEYSGVALALPSLAGISDLAGSLDVDDSAVLRWWIAAADRASLWLLVDRRNAGLAVYGPPRPLETVLAAARRSDAPREPAPAVQPAVADSAAAMELSEPPPSVEPCAEPAPSERTEPPPAVVEQDGALAFQQPLPSDEDAAPTIDAEPEPARVSDGRRAVHALGDIAEAVLKSLADGSPTVPAPPDFCETAGDTTPAADAGALVDAASEPEPPRPVAATAEREEPVEADAGGPIAVPPLFPNAGEHWRTWTRELETARGAKPLAAIERMFVASYVPLAYAVSRQIADPECARVLERWSTSFGQSYREAFDALRVRGKRPAMVLDVPELALRIGRLHGARSVQLLLVDGMRFDLGLRVEQRVRALVGQQAALAERLLLWSALPSTTEVQLDLIGRGPEGLRAGQPLPDVEVPVARGRAASTLRRVKAGHRELLKLDWVEASLAEPGAPEPERLDRVADGTARTLADYLTKQVPRTLVFAFGDHGFALDALDAGTTRARKGGASPEEVLVPGFAWLVGGVH